MSPLLFIAVAVAALELVAYAAMWTPYLALVSRFSLPLDGIEGAPASLEHAAGHGETGSAVWRAVGGTVWMRHRFTTGARANNTFVVRLQTGSPPEASWGVPLLGAITAFGVSYALYIAARVVAPEQFAHEVLDAQRLVAHVGLLVTITASSAALVTLIGRHIARVSLEEWFALQAQGGDQGGAPDPSP